MKEQKITLLIISILLAIIVMFIPTIIIGKFSFEESSYMGSLLTAEFVMRTTSFIVGVLIIYDGIKKYFVNK